MTSAPQPYLLDGLLKGQQCTPYSEPRQKSNRDHDQARAGIQISLCHIQWRKRLRRWLVGDNDPIGGVGYRCGRNNIRALGVNSPAGI